MDMRQILISASIAAALAITPALAAKPDHPTKPPHPAKCKINSAGYNAKGTLTTNGLTQTAGADTATDKSDDRYSGDLTVDVTRANHKAPKGPVTYHVTNAKVSFYDAANDGTDDAPAPGDTVRVHGKLTKYKHKCPGADLVYTIKSVSFQQAAPPAA
jgi:hypothetical protein